jgi:biotin carboxylase
MPRVLLLLPTTTYRTQAFMQAARRLGVEVTVGSEEPSTVTTLNPAGLITLDFSDPAEAARQVAQFAAQHPIDAVIPVDDQVTLVGAAICKALALPSNSVESAGAARNKFRMRELLARANVAQPGYRLCTSAADASALARAVGYPCVVKPLSLAASRGVIRADDESALIAAVQRLLEIVRRASDDAGMQACEEPGQFLIEEYLPGQEIALEGLLTAGELRVLALFDKPDPLEGPFFEETIYVTPSRLPVEVQDNLARCTTRACLALGLSEGPVHAELRLNPTNHRSLPARRHSEPLTTHQTTHHSLLTTHHLCWVIEINPRSIGGLCSRVLRFGTGLSLEELIIRHALERDYSPPLRKGQAAGVMMIPIPRAGVLTEVRGQADARAVAGIEEVVISAHAGQQLVPLPEGSLYLGFIFARGPTPEKVEAALRTAHARLEFVIETPV